jgi:hypothetical protein
MQPRWSNDYGETYHERRLGNWSSLAQSIQSLIGPTKQELSRIILTILAEWQERNLGKRRLIAWQVLEDRGVMTIIIQHEPSALGNESQSEKPS